MIHVLNNPKVIQFIQENLHVNTADLVLASAKYPKLPIKEIASQIESRKRIKNKLPEWYANTALILPRKENLEQASSEETAKYKALMVTGKRMLDLTGGSGVDAYAFCKKFESIDYVEPNLELCELANHNFKMLGCQINVHHATAEKYLASNSAYYDLIYLDPSRRDESKHRLIALEEYSPNVVALQEDLFEYSDRILVKASPMMDIHQAIKQLQNVEKVICLAIANEMKEVLFLLNKSIDNAEPEIICENIGNPISTAFKFYYSNDRAAIPTFSEPLTFVYDPLTAIRKSGGFNTFGERFKLNKLAPNTQLFTSEDFKQNVPARSFRVLAQLPPTTKAIKKAAINGYINVISKNYPLSANEIKRKYRLQDGGEQFLIFCSSSTQNYVLLCEMLTH